MFLKVFFYKFVITLGLDLMVAKIKSLYFMYTFKCFLEVLFFTNFVITYKRRGALVSGLAVVKYIIFLL